MRFFSGFLAGIMIAGGVLRANGSFRTGVVAEDRALKVRHFETAVKSQVAVYICNSANASRYHLTEKCRGLNRCLHKIERTSKKTAEAKGLTLCKFEY